MVPKIRFNPFIRIQLATSCNDHTAQCFSSCLTLIRRSFKKSGHRYTDGDTHETLKLTEVIFGEKSVEIIFSIFRTLIHA